MHEPLSPQQLQQQQEMYKKIPSLFEIVVRPTGQLAEKLGVRWVSPSPGSGERDGDGGFYVSNEGLCPNALTQPLTVGASA